MSSYPHGNFGTNTAQEGAAASTAVPHGGFSVGMVRDLPSWALPPGACFDAQDLLVDRPGRIRKRGGSTSPAAGNSTASVENLLSFKSGGYDGATAVLGSSGKGSSIKINSFNTATGATTTISSIAATANTFAAKPFQHQNWGVFPFSALATTSNDWNALFFCGGSTTPLGSSFAPAAATVVAGDSRITGISGTSVIASMVGSVIWLQNGTTNYYFGRIVEAISTNSVRVEPTPTIGLTATGGIVGIAAYKWDGYAPFTGVGDVLSARFGVSFQGRVVLGYTTRTIGTAQSDYVKGLNQQPNRVYWSQLPSESIPASITGTLDGDPALYPGFFLGTSTTPYFNWVDIPGLGGMTALATVGEGQLIVFGPRRAYRISGTLATETTVSPAFSFSVDLISQSVGCISSRSIAFAPIGLIFAWIDGLYVYDGSSLKPLILGKNARYFQDRLRNGDVILGSFFSEARNHYYLSMSGTDGGLMLDLENHSLSRMTNLQLFDAVPDPADQTKLWGARWWDTTGAAPTMTKGQLIGLESIWLPTSANKNDADGTAVLASFQSPAYVDGPLSYQKLVRKIKVTYDLRGTGSLTASLSADVKLNVADASYTSLATAGGTLADTTASADTGLGSIDSGTLLPEGQAIEIKVAMNAAANTFELLQLEIDSQTSAQLL